MAGAGEREKMKCFFVMMLIAGAIFTPAEAKAPFMFASHVGHSR